MHTHPLPPETRSRNKKVVAWLVSIITVFTVLSLMYLVKYGVNFQRHGFH